MDKQIRKEFPTAQYLVFQTNTGGFIVVKKKITNKRVSGLTCGSVGHCFVHKDEGPRVHDVFIDPETLPADLLSELREFLPGLGLPNSDFAIVYEWQHGCTMPEFEKVSYFRKFVELIKKYKLETFMALAGLNLQPQLSKIKVKVLAKKLKEVYTFQPLVQVVKKTFFQLIIGLDASFEPVSAITGWVGAKGSDEIGY